MAEREDRDSATGVPEPGPRPGRRRAARPTRRTRAGRWWGWLPEVLVVILLAVAGVQAQFEILPAPAETAALPRSETLRLDDGRDAPAIASAAGGAIDPAKVRAAIGALSSSPGFGPRIGVLVADGRTGRPLFQRGPSVVTPASTLKLATAVAALQVLGPDHRFVTTTTLTGRTVTLIGGGDPLLATSRASARGLVPARASLGDLARSTAASLRARGVDSVRVQYDPSRYSGPSINPAWPANYRPDGVVPPIVPLWADQGRSPDGGYLDDPARSAAAGFVRALRAQRITVTGLAARSAPTTGTVAATVRSAPLSQIVEHTVAVSDNNAAEVLGREIALATGRPGSFVGAAQAIRAALAELGIPLDGAVVRDASGLSREDRLSLRTLTAILDTAASTDRLSAAVTGLPVGGLTGSLLERLTEVPRIALGVVRVKTGTLTGVHGFAGFVETRDGRLLSLVAVADRVAEMNTLTARALLDRIAAALAGCRCAVPSTASTPSGSDATSPSP